MTSSLRNSGRCRFALALPFLAATLSAHAADLVTNGDFETGNLTGWSKTGTFAGAYSGYGVGGSYGAIFYYDPCSYSQTITTVVGKSYTFSFDLTSMYGTALFSANFGGQTVLNLIGIPVNFPNFDHYEYTVTATSASTLISFQSNSAGPTGLDNVSVVAAPTAAPGPVAALPFALLALRRRRKA